MCRRCALSAYRPYKSQGLTLERIKLGLGKKEFCSGLTFVGLSRVKTLDSILLVDRVDFCNVLSVAVPDILTSR